MVACLPQAEQQLAAARHRVQELRARRERAGAAAGALRLRAAEAQALQQQLPLLQQLASQQVRARAVSWEVQGVGAPPPPRRVAPDPGCAAASRAAPGQSAARSADLLGMHPAGGLGPWCCWRVGV